LLLILRGLLNPNEALLPVALSEYVLHVFTHLRVVPEEASDEVVGQELVKVYHLDKIDVKVESHFILVGTVDLLDLLAA
jgi:hypothetical protein